MHVRPADPHETPALARLWHQGWHEAHAAHVPEELTRLRTEDDFARRLRGFGDRLFVAGPPGVALGLCVTDGALLDQLFVAPEARGTGLAAQLLAAGEARIAAAGHRRAELDCLPENARARRFYAAHGWRERGIEPAKLATSAGTFTLPCVIFEKPLA
ncbi:MAG: GNAT family N-acetyltransferase [Pseudomonadota bacterium]